MAKPSEIHRTPANGIGKCSVPMWQLGCPAGFCDEPAYGEQTKEYLKRFRHLDPKYWQPAFASGLACHAHGGPLCPPNIVVEKDGDAWCAHMQDFVNLQESPAGFGDTLHEAIAALKAQESEHGS